MPRDDPRARAVIARQNAARTAAVRRLIDAHADEYRTIYYEECEKVGVQPSSQFMATRKKIAALAEEIRASGVLDGVEIPPTRPRALDPLPEGAINATQRMTRAEMLDRRAARIPPLPVVKADEKPYVPPPPF